MHAETQKKHLDRNRPMTSVTIRMPEEVVTDLKRLAPLLGFSGYQPLVRAYVGKGLREDRKRLDRDRMEALVSSLKRKGVSATVIKEALAEAKTRQYAKRGRAASKAKSASRATAS